MTADDHDRLKEPGPPAWFKGKELTAQDLWGFERYIFSRHRLNPSEVAGLESFVTGRSLVVQTIDDRLEVSASELCGVAGTGHPIHLGLEPVLGSFDLAGMDRFRVWLEVIESDADYLNENPPLGKYRLVCGSPDQVAAPYGLDLGVYQADGQWLELPRLRKVSALALPLENWTEWTPLRKELEARLNAVASGKVRSKFSRAYECALCELAFEWQDMLLPDLVRKIVFVEWLSRTSIVPPPDRRDVEQCVQRVLNTRTEELPGEFLRILKGRKDKLPEEAGEKLGAELVEIRHNSKEGTLQFKIKFELAKRKLLLNIPSTDSTPDRLRVALTEVSSNFDGGLRERHPDCKIRFAEEITVGRDLGNYHSYQMPAGINTSCILTVYGLDEPKGVVSLKSD